MKIVVLVKHVPDAQFDRHLTGPGNTVDRSESILSELDEYALEAALQISEDHGGEKGGNTVIALTMGPDAASNAIKKSLQIGATEGYHLNDAALAGSDVAATSTALAAALESIAASGAVDLVVTGMASTEGETSLVPAQLAARLGWAYLGHARELEVAGSSVTITRDADGFTEKLQGSLPAVVSVTDAINEPRYPNFKGIIAAKRKKTHPLSVSDLAVDGGALGSQGSLAVLESATERPAREQGTIITDDGSAAVQLADFLAAQKLI